MRRLLTNLAQRLGHVRCYLSFSICKCSLADIVYVPVFLQETPATVKKDSPSTAVEAQVTPSVVAPSPSG